MTPEPTPCAICSRPITGRSPDVKVIDEVVGVLHLSCARKTLGTYAFLVPSFWYAAAAANGGSSCK